MADSSYESVTPVQADQPISRTYQYRKVMKPMLERKRRARINRCLDELKEIMSAALASEGENLTKLEKADVLELTVRHLHKLRERQALGLNSSSASQSDKYRAGFTHCAAEVSRFLAASTGLDVTVGQRLLSHLGRCVQQMDRPNTPVISTPVFSYSAAALPSSFGASTYTPPCSPSTTAPHVQISTPAPPSMMLSPVSSPALSEADSTPCDYSKYSAFQTQIAVAPDNGKVWRPW